MTTDEMVVDVSQDWVLACDVQQRFMQGLGRTSNSVDYSARCRQVRALGGDCYDFIPPNLGRETDGVSPFFREFCNVIGAGVTILTKGYFPLFRNCHAALPVLLVFLMLPSNRTFRVS
jgi:hypothetical protein